MEESNFLQNQNNQNLNNGQNKKFRNLLIVMAVIVVVFFAIGFSSGYCNFIPKAEGDWSDLPDIATNIQWNLCHVLGLGI